MKSRLLTAQFNQAGQALENVLVMAGIIGKRRVQLFLCPDMPVDRTNAPGVLDPLVVVLRAEKTMDIDGGNALQGKHDRVSADESIGLQQITSVGDGSLQRIV